jgi:hypothetical protein
MIRALKARRVRWAKHEAGIKYMRVLETPKRRLEYDTKIFVHITV